MGDVEQAARPRTASYGNHFEQVSEDVRQVADLGDKIGKRAARIEELDFRPQAPSEPAAAGAGIVRRGADAQAAAAGLGCPSLPGLTGQSTLCQDELGA